MIEKLERLTARGIQLLPAAIPAYYAFSRDGFVSLVERAGGGFGQIGAPGVLTGTGLAVLVWRGEEAFFVGKDFEQPATSQQVEQLRSFFRDLQEALA